MKIEVESVQEREAAGIMLAEKLRAYNKTSAIVVGIPPGGACVAAAIASALSLRLELLPCRRIADPSDNQKTIGAVTAGEITMHDVAHDIPQDYLAHQIILLRNAMAQEQRTYYDKSQPQSLQNRTVILVNDVYTSPEILLTALRGVKKQKPHKVIVAAPLVSPETERTLGIQADELQFIKSASISDSGESFCRDLPVVDTPRINMLLKNSWRAIDQRKPLLKVSGLPTTQDKPQRLNKVSDQKTVSLVKMKR
jgi:predicted phosphoribosyltransferase